MSSAASPLRLLLLLLALVPSDAKAIDPGRLLSQYIHDSWSTNDGLPQDSINSIVQTPDGYLWIATQEGIARFNGNEFVLFDSRTTQGKIGNFVYTLFVDRSGTLWAGSAGGLLRYDGGSSFTAFDQKSGWPGTSARAIFEDESGSLWIGFGSQRSTGGKGLLRFTNGKIKVLTTRDGLASDQVYAICAGRKKDELWVGTGKGLNLMQAGKFTTFGLADGLPDDFIKTILKDRSGNIWIGTSHGLSRFADGRFTNYRKAEGLIDDDILSLFEDRDGVLWIGTGKGVSRRVKGKIESAANMKGLSDDVIFDFLEDREGSLWIGTHAGGLHRLRAGKFTAYGPPEGFLGESVNGILGDRKGRIWFGTSPGGVNVLENGSVRSYNSLDGLSTDNSRALLEDRNGTIWIGTSDGLNRLESGRITSYSTKDGLPSKNINVVFEDRNGSVWVGTSDGLARRQGVGFVPVPLPQWAPSSIRVLHEDRVGRFWIGGGDGFGTFRDGKFESYRGTALANANVQSLLEDLDGTIWLATWGDGLYRFNRGGLTRYTVADGLFDDTAWSILDDGVGNLWMGSNRGISRISRKQFSDFDGRKISKLTPVVYGSADGMRRRETNTGSPSAFRSTDGRLWFGTTGGAVVIDPARIATNSLPPPVTIEDFLVDETSIPVHSAAILEAGVKNIEIRYAALSLTAPSRVKYRYKLEGYEERWIEAGGRRSAFYTNIDPGKYTFRVIAANEDGVWNTTGATLTFRIRPLFYQTPWFYALVVLALIFSGIGIKALRERHVKIQHQIYHDPLTGLPNRILLTQRAEVALTQAGRRDHSIAILFLDLDGFKGVNDSLGHASGDQLLQLIAMRLRACIREIDTIARIGGDEFAVLTADLADESSASEVAHRMIDAMKSDFVLDAQRVKLGLSIGIAIHPFDGTDVRTMLQAADRAMYRAKLAGGNSYQFNAADPSEILTI